MAGPDAPKTGGRQAGTPNKATAEVRVLAQNYTAAAVLALAEIMENRDAPPAARVSAASALLDRGHGKPPQAITGAHGKDLIPERSADPARTAALFVSLVRGLPAPAPAPAIENSNGGGESGAED
jgi:hypothetical protein